MKTWLQKIGLQGAIIPCTISLMALQLVMGAVKAQSAWVPPPPPPDHGTPGNRFGRAGRGCGLGKQSSMALAPAYQRSLVGGGENTQVWGTTTTERPTFWFDVPYERGAIAAVEFVLQDNANPAKDLYRSAIVPPDAPGIVSIQLPATVPPLETGTLYQWFFKVRLQCGSKETLYGWVQRVSPDAALTSQLKQATPQQQADLYAQKGIWFDALTTLGNIRLTNPQNPRAIADWNGLLQSVGLETLTTKPLVPCCKPKP